MPEQLAGCLWALGWADPKGNISRGLLADAKAGKNPYEGLKPEVPQGERLFGETGPGSKAYADFEVKGMAQLAKTCFCLVAGGLGERLGYPGGSVN
eukprot:Skav215055  [mRNA]  locus=scaffold1021:257487:266689:- [translate_table: standard]